MKEVIPTATSFWNKKESNKYRKKKDNKNDC